MNNDPGEMNTPKYSDRWLIEQVVLGEEKCFKVLTDRYFATVERIANNHLRNRDDAAEVIQEAFLIFFLSLVDPVKCGRILAILEREEQYIKRFLCCVTRRAAINAIRKRRQQPMLPLEAAATHPSALGNPREEYEKTERYHALLDALGELAPEERDMIVLFHFQGLHDEDIVKKTELSPETVRTRRSRAMKKLRNIMQQSEDIAE